MMPRTWFGVPKDDKPTVIPGYDDRDLAQAVALVRMGIGLTLFVMPRRSVRLWTGDQEPSVGAVMSARGLGARDVALAVGTMIALDDGARVRGWLEAGALADASDMVGTLAQWRSLPKMRRLLFLVTSAGAVYQGLRLADALDDT